MKNTHPFMEKAAHLIEALPYIRRFYGKTIVIKCGGSVMTDMKTMMQDIALLHFCGMRPVIIHGGGPEISDMCKQLNMPVQFLNGQRVTDSETLAITQMVLLGKTNCLLVSMLNQLGAKAIGLSGHDASFLKAEKFDSEGHLGFVGKITAVDINLIHTLQTAGFIPVIAPVGVDQNGQAYNINADVAAGSIASHLVAEKFIILSDVNGLYSDMNDPTTQINQLNSHEAKHLIDNKKISGGMIPKLQSCLDSVLRGVSSAHILSGKLLHSLLLEILSDQGIGTMIVK